MAEHDFDTDASTRPPADGPAGFPSLLRARAAERPDGIAYVFLGAGDAEDSVTYRELDRRARALAVRFRDCADPGERALLLCPPGREYVESFFGCLYAGLIAVPAYPPRGARDAERVAGIAGDCTPALVVHGSGGAPEFPDGPAGAAFAHLPRAAADEGSDADADLWTGPAEDADAVAFLQYTSGSTATPRGVVLHHRHLLHNTAVVARVFGLGPQDRSVSWLPPYHDMGLIGGILQPLYSGFPGALMPPMAFLRDPAAWLRAISRTGTTISTAPTFAYEECVRRVPDEALDDLDLSRWHHALVGAEPVHAETLGRFARRFAACGFDGSAFFPCYGLAEATLFVTGPERGTGARATAFAKDALAAGRAVEAHATTGAPEDRQDDSSAVQTLVACGHVRDPDSVLIVDPRTRRAVEPGTVGEIWVNGPTVARGYWGRPADTDRLFRARLAGDERTFLRTGDLGFEHDGDVYIAGRSKDLIVVRGRNLYPQDLEAIAQKAHPALRPNRLIAFGVEEPGAGEQVVLVCEAAGPEARDRDGILDAVSRAVATESGVRLADVVIVGGGKVPRTSSGKVRRAACKARYLSGELPVLASLKTAGTSAAGASTARAEELRARVAAVLRLRDASELRLSVPLVAQGLDSLRAAELLAVLDAEFGFRLEFEALFSMDPLGDVLRGVAGEPAGRGGRTGIGEAAGAGAATDRSPEDGGGAETGRHAAASPGQQRLFTLNRLGASAAYHLAGGIRFRGRLDLDALDRALGAIRRRNPSLRTTFEFSGADTGKAVLQRVVRPWTERPLEPVDLSGDDGTADEKSVTAWCERLALRPFDLGREEPFRYALARLAEDEHVLCVVFHHIAVDGWSVSRIVRQMEHEYELAAQGADAGSASPGRPVAADGPASARTRTGDDDATPRTGLDYWAQTLDGVPDLNLPTDTPRTAERSHAGDRLPLPIGTDLMDGVRRLARTAGVTPFMVFLAGFAAMLSRRSGQDRFVVGIPYSLRAPGDDEVGYNVNTLPLVVDTSGDPTYLDLLARVRTAALSAYRHAATPFEQIVHERAARTGTRQDTLIRAMLIYNGHDLEPWNQRGLLAEPFVSDLPATICDLAVHLTETGTGGLSGNMSYSTALFGEISAQSLRTSLLGVLTAAVAAPAERLSALTAVEASERDRIVYELSGARGAAVFDGCVDVQFGRRVAAAPDATAAVFGDAAISYRRLDEDANRLARHLLGLGVRPGDIVGVHLNRSLLLPTAALAVLKAGAAYLPLDPQYPAERLETVVRDARPAVVLTSAGTLAEPGAPQSWREGAAQAGVPVVDLEAAADAIARNAADPLPSTAHPDSPAYVIFTSGSTGTPKGVVNTHRGLANYLAGLTGLFGDDPDGAVLHNTPIAFDVSVGELLWPLVSGRKLVLPRASRIQEPEYLAQLISAERVTTCTFVPSTLRLFLSHQDAGTCAGTLRDVICIGEQLPADVAAKFERVLIGSRLHNHYGPAEAAIAVTAHQVEPGAGGGRVPIGRALPGARVYVLDGSLNPVPAGTAGDLYISGVCLALGYLGRPGATAEVFLPHPFEAGARIYRTGDVARWRPDGNLEYLGRADRQLKIRGQRVEPDEIESVLNGHPAVASCAVRGVSDDRGGVRIGAYIVCDQAEPSVADVRAYLFAKLPRHMVPVEYMFLPELPLGSTGKVSYSDLPDFASARPGGKRAPAPPSNPVEQRVVRLFSVHLSVDAVGADDDFYELGGHSLLAIQIIAGIRESFGVELDPADLLVRHTTARGIARLVVERQMKRARPEELRRALARLRAMSAEETAALLGRSAEGR
ncbi:non-ribosomal peptide synthetase [Actinomadura formosensis]|uniref:non-ribosomal peptide synthetase n=1 Tax=Actinomadura formosensis TaxID=60706 RepID=UPI0008328BCF|nr:non-ribosomal peptide synthetase [Actinomadura formosensis]